MSVVSLSLGVTWPLLLNPIKRYLSLHPNVMVRKIYTISMKDQEKSPNFILASSEKSL